MTERMRIVVYWTWGIYWRARWKSIVDVVPSQAVPS